MQLLLDRGDELNMDWHPGCIYDGNGNYYYGPVGRRGPGVTDEDLKNPFVVPSIPTCLQYTISLKNNDAQLYKLIITALTDLKNSGDVIDVKMGGVRHVREKIKVKDECKEIVDKITLENNQLKDKFTSLADELDKLGCDTSDVGCPKYKLIPDEYFEWNEYDDYKTCISVGCHNGTIFYKFLQKNGLLEKYFPQWYKDGKF